MLAVEVSALPLRRTLRRPGGTQNYAQKSLLGKYLIMVTST